mgnify:CR=1 FL=1|tara:strand:- start:367 stop:1140 length:774 start_codon:yes stop_codon:yes gene_type:complete
MVDFLNKLKIFLESRKLFRNWYIYPLIYLKISRSEFKILETIGGFKMKIRIRSTDLMQLTTIWVIKEYDIPGFEIKDNDTIIDIGGHIGLFTVFCKQFSNRGKIFCYEPFFENYKILKDNIKMNNLNNVISNNMAVSKIDGIIPIYLSDDDSGHSILEKNSNSIDVQSISLKKIFDINNIKRCNLLKLDCEGSEYEIIESLPEDYFEKIDKMIIEYHFAKKYPELYSKLLGKLELMSYSVNVKKINEDMGMIFALKN